MTYKKNAMNKYQKINRDKLSPKGKDLYDKLKSKSNNFENTEGKLGDILEAFYKKTQGDVAKPKAKAEPKKTPAKKKATAKKKTTKKKSTAKKKTTAKKATAKKATTKGGNTGSFAKLRAEIAKREGITYIQALPIAKKEYAAKKASLASSKKVKSQGRLAAFKKKYKGRGTEDVKESGTMRALDVSKDAKIPALKRGKRVSKGTGANQYGKAKKGKIYYENRSNRSDVRQPQPTNIPRLAKGGDLDFVFENKPYYAVTNDENGAVYFRTQNEKSAKLKQKKFKEIFSDDKIVIDKYNFEENEDVMGSFNEDGDIDYAKGGDVPKELEDAIKEFENRIKKQGRITNARDEKHLKRLNKEKIKYASRGESSQVFVLQDDDFGNEIYRGIDELNEYLAEFNKAYNENYKTYKEFNEGEENQGRYIVRSYADGGRINIVNEGEKFNKRKYKGALGDFDNDGVANIDDARPLVNTGKKETVEQVELAKTFDKLLKLKSQLDSTMNVTVDELDEVAPKGAQIYARTKTPYSILNKLVEKRLLDKNKGLTDLVGTTIAVDNYKDLRAVDSKIRGGAIGKVVEIEDMYDTPKGGYRAVHYLVESDGYIIEVQLKTKRQKDVNVISHNAYKKGTLNKQLLLDLTDLANRADKEDAKAKKEFSKLMKDKKAVEKKLDTSFEFGGEIARSYDVNINSGVGTYAKGGEIEEEEVQYGSWYVEISEDENDEEIRNQEVARLIRDGYMSGFEPTWSLEITDIDGDIDEPTEEEIARLVEQGYTSGEVVMYKYAKGGKTKAKKWTKFQKWAILDSLGYTYTLRLVSVKTLDDKLTELGVKSHLGSSHAKGGKTKTKNMKDNNDWIQSATKEMQEKGTVGAFTKQANRREMTPVDFAKMVLKTPDAYSETTRKRAQFVKNANPELFSFGGEIARGYDVNINSGVGTYAKGGITEAGDTDFPSELLNYAKGGKTKGFENGEIVWDSRNKTYGVVLNNYDNKDSEIRLDSDGNQPIEYLHKLNSKGDKGNKKDIVFALNQHKILVDEYDYEKVNYAKGGKIEAEWLVVLEDKDGYEIDEIVFAKSEDEAYNKAEKLNPNSNARLIVMLTDYNGRKVEYAKGGKTQGYDSRLDESLGNRTGAEVDFEQKKKDRRDESKAMEKSMGKRAYSSVRTMDRNNDPNDLYGAFAKGGRVRYMLNGFEENPNYILDSTNGVEVAREGSLEDGDLVIYFETKDEYAKGGNVGQNGYIAMYKGKKIEVYADSSYAAQKKAAEMFNAKKSYDVRVYLAEKDGKTVMQSTMFGEGGITEAGDTDFPSELLNYAKGGRTTIDTLAKAKGKKILSLKYDIGINSTSGVKNSNDTIVKVILEDGSQFTFYSSNRITGFYQPKSSSYAQDLFPVKKLDFAKGGKTHTMPDGTIMLNSEHYAKGGEVELSKKYMPYSYDLEDIAQFSLGSKKMEAMSLQEVYDYSNKLIKKEMKSSDSNYDTALKVVYDESLKDADDKGLYAKGGRSKSRDDKFLSQEKHEQEYAKKRKKKVSYKKRK